MAGRSAYKIAHDDPSCKSLGKPVQVFLNDDGTTSAYCFSCCKPVNLGEGHEKPDHIHVKSYEEMEQDVADIRTCPYPDQTFRGLTPESLKYFGVRMMLSEYDGKTPFALALPYTNSEGKLCQFKVRTLAEKKMWWLGVRPDDGVDLFGWLRAKSSGAKTLYITEGEYDAIALRQILKEMNKGGAYKDQEFAVVSIPNGINSALESLERQGEDLDTRFDEIVLVFDDDVQGQEAAKRICSLYPDTLNVRLPEKDANECLIKGKLKATRDAVIFRAQAVEFTDTRSFASYEEEALEPIVMGKSLPWQGLTDLIYGFREQEFIAIGGGTGCGKTLIGHELAAWFSTIHREEILMCMMEETPRETVQNVCGKLDNIPYHIPELEFDKEKLRETIRSVTRITLWEPENRTDPVSTWESIKRSIKAGGGKYKMIIIDNLTILSEGMNSSERNDFIGAVAGDCAELMLKLNCKIIVLSHLNPPDKKARSHEEGAPVLESQFTGSRALQRYCTLMFGFARNKKAVDPSCSYIECLKHRKYGRVGLRKTYYKRNTGRLIEQNWSIEDFESKKLD